MAVNNSLKPLDFENATVEYKSNDETVKLSPFIVKKYLTNGNGSVTDQEIAMFINLCKYQHLNPFLREAYLIKYGDNASLVVGKDVFTKRAIRNPKYAGNQAGVCVLGTNGIENRIGCIVLKDETLVGGWAKVFIKSYEAPIEITVSMDEYTAKVFDRESKTYVPNRQWKEKPATMIRKVALVQALREAFPEDMQGMYSAEEMGIVEPVAEPITQPEIEPEPKPEKSQKGKIITVDKDEQIPLPFSTEPVDDEEEF